jgi:hypothetical protein
VYVANGIAVGRGSGVQRSIVAAGAPTVVLGHDVQGQGPRALGRKSSTFAHHGVELDFGDFEPVRDEATWSAGGHDVVRMWWAVLWRTSR